jgi:FG-GAP-like repeat/FG-GAP repeat
MGGNRFLGWKYAAMAHQDTTGWVKPHAIRAPSSAQARSQSFPQTAHATNPTSASAAGFESAHTLPTGFMPTAVVTGDFNEDGKPDLAISNGGDNTIYVYIGNGDGTFGVPEILYTAGQSPVWLADAKLSQNGHLDLITVDGDSNQLEVFSGKGDGTFQPGSVVSLPQTPSFVLAGDFNNDGNTDLAVGLVIAPLSSGAQFVVVPGNGAGGFLPAILPPAIDNVYETPIVTNWLAAGDINGDGFLDLVPTVAFAAATTYLNLSGTAFQIGNSFAPASGAVTVALADVTNHGCLDAVETDAAGFLTIATGDCHGDFPQQNPVAQLGDIDVAIMVADVNGDGNLDVIASAAFSDTEAPAGLLTGAYGGYLVSVLSGNGSGGFSPTALYRVGSQAYGLTVADLRSNGRPDIFTVSQQESTVSQLSNDGNGGFGNPSGETIGYLNGVWNAPIPDSPVQTIDLNGDGKPDVLLVEFGMTSTLPSEMTALLNHGNGQLSAPVRSPIPVVPGATSPLIVAGDFRNASAADVIYVAQNTSPNVAAFMRGNGDGTFALPVTLANLPNPYELVSGDFNHDGKLDFAVWGYSAAGSVNTEELDIFLGNGDGTFKQMPAYTFAPLTTALPQQLIAGDFNHDGKLDLLMGHNENGGWVDSGDDLDLALGNGDGTFQPVTTLMAHFGPVAVGDLNHDGYLDLIQARDPDADITQQALTAAGGPFITPAVTIYLGGPGGKFTRQATYYTPGIQLPSYYPALLGDFNGDGNLDVALPYIQATIGRPWEQRLQILQGAGDGTFDPGGIPFQLPAYDQPSVGGDYRGVGMTDLLDLVGSTSSINTISATPSPVLALTADSNPLTGSQGSATVTLALPAASNQTVQLTSSDAAVTLPTSISFSAGQQQQSFSFAVGSGFDSSHLLALTATLGGQSATAYFAGKANPNAASGVTALIGASTQGTASVSTSPGASIQLLFTLQSVQGYSGIFSNFACSGLPAAASCDFAASTLTLLPGGYAQVAFTLNAGSATPEGTFHISVAAGNGEISPSAPLTLGIGGFAVSLNPSMIQVNAPTQPIATVSANFTNGYNQQVQLACNGLPAGTTCTIDSVLYPGVTSEPIAISGAQTLAAQDYPFTITGTAVNLSSTANVTLRVSNFTAALQSNMASLASGKSATFNILLASVNHFSNGNISISCQAPSTITCNTTTEYFMLSDGGTLTVPLAVSYKPSGAAAHPSARSTTWLPALFLPVLLMSSTRRRGTRRTALFTLVGAVVLGASFTACGGGNGSTGGGTPPGGPTIPGPTTINIPVTVQADTGSGNLQQNAGTIALTVQP